MLTQFFTKGRGITLTSAQTIHNFAKERREALMQMFKNLSFTDEFRDLVGTECPSKKVKSGITPDKAETIVAVAQKIADLDRLCAWLGEATKAKVLFMEMANKLTLDDFNKDHDAPKCPVYQDLDEYAKSQGIELVVPHKTIVSEEDVLREFTVKELNEYYGCNSESAVYGKLVHEDGVINYARKELHKAISSPYELTQSLIKLSTPTCSTEMVDGIFTKLQGLQRKYNAEHNAFEARVKARLDELKKEASNEYLTALTKYNAEKKRLQEEIDKSYRFQMDAFDEATIKHLEAFKIWKDEQIAEAASLKIVIPETLDPLFTELDAELKA